MNNQKGEATLFCVLILVALSGLLTLCGLKLQYTFQLTKKRTQLFLCAKEAKGELNLYLKKMERLNWVIKNSSKAQLVAVFIPPLWPQIGNADKLKKLAKTLQLMSIVPYMNHLRSLKKQGCPLDPQILLTPYTLGNDFGFTRSSDGVAKLRSKKWTYYFLQKPYLLDMNIDATLAEGVYPRVVFVTEEKMGTLSSLLSSR